MKGIRWVALVLVALIIIAGLLWYVSRSTDGTARGPATAVVARRDLATSIDAMGTVRAMVGAEVKVGARVSGKVDKLYANVGDRVERGQLIALIDDRELRTRVDKARAELAAAEARWRQARADAVAQPAQSLATIEEAQTSARAAQARLEQAETASTAQPAISDSQVEQARRQVDTAQARLEQAKATAAAEPSASEARIAQAQAAAGAAEANLARVKRGARSEEIAQAEAAVRRAESKLQQADKNLDRAGSLHEKGFVAAQETDRLRTERDVARADLETARERLTVLKTQTLPEDLRRAEGELQQARARLREAQSAAVGVELRQRDVAAAEAELQRAEAALRAAEAARSQVPIKQQEVQAARADADRTQAALRKARSQQVQDQLKQRAADAARAQVTQAKAALEAAETELSYARITAPISGTVASVATQEGETVAAGLAAPTFITIVDLARLEVHAYVDETDIGKVEEGQGAQFTVDAHPDREFAGIVTAIYPKAEITQNVVEYNVVIRVDETEDLLKPDMTATVTIRTEEHRDVLTVPNDAIRREGGQRVVYVLDKGTPVARPIKTGLRDTQYTQVLEGVKEGDSVLVGDMSR